MFVNIITAFVLIFIGHQSRNLEINNKNLENNISELKQKININEIELAFHNDNHYLNKLFSIYNNDAAKIDSADIIKLSELADIKYKDIFKVKYK